MSTCVIKLIGTAQGIRTPHCGRYVQSYAPATLFEDGIWGSDGHLVTTDKREDAQRFSNVADAIELYTAQKGVRPYDGRPNRPLTAWHATFEQANNS